MSEVHLPQLIAESFGGSRSEARRKLAQGGVKLNGERLSPEQHTDMDAEELNGELMLGRRQTTNLINGVPTDA